MVSINRQRIEGDICFVAIGAAALSGKLSLADCQLQGLLLPIRDGRGNFESLQIMIGLLVIINLLSMVVCYQIAKSRKADRWYWLFVALLIGPFAIPFVFFAGPSQR